MTEAEWLTGTNPRELLDFVQDKARDRQLILYSLACWTTAEYYSEPDWVEAITELTDSVLSGKLHLARLIGLFGAFNFDTPPTPQCWARMATLENHSSDANAKSLQIAFLRDIFGNPFRPVSFNPAWRTDTAVAVARQMYESRDFGAMPILADALQDAGCEDEQVLTHCREAGGGLGEPAGGSTIQCGPHVRGCWVCDAVLGFA